MKKNGRFLMALLSCLCLILAATTVSAQPAQPAQAPDTLEGLVVGVTEGDRITVNSFGTEIHVRLYGLAAPQTAKIDKFTGWYKAGQPYAEEAFRALSIKVLHQKVKVEIRQSVLFKNDSKPLAIAIVYLDGRNINLEMLADGWGWVFKKFLEKGDLEYYLAVEKQARAKKHGLWLQDNPQPPWHFKPQLRVKLKPGAR